MSDAPAAAAPTAKGLLQSKTFWLQIVSTAAVFLPAVQSWLLANPVEFVAVLGALNILVRFATSGKISLFGAGETSKASTMGIVFWVGTVAGALVLLPSCSPDGSFPFKATLIMEDGAISYSSKGGIEASVYGAAGRMPTIYREK
jgi:hypothetical protein